MGYGFQTPPAVADRMVAMAAEDASVFPLSILEPCSGLGSLVAAARRAFPKARVDVSSWMPTIAASSGIASAMWFRPISSNCLRRPKSTTW